jgi:hypothetical protein
MALGQSSVGGMAEVVDAHDLMLGAEEYLMDSELRETHGKRARDTVLQYSWAKEVLNLERVVTTI